MPFLPSALRKCCQRLSHESFRNFFALHDVSIEVQKGESFGIIGRNGSGKSTLLQIIAGILAPAGGSVTVNGRVAALLELGSGFNPEFTGRENVYMNATVLGLSRAQIDERFDAIAAFADIGDFIDQPIKTYSSGMLVRLAFAVTTSVDADVLLIDEALAVGDVFFRQKCYQHLEALRSRGVTIVLVSHAMGDVEQFCRRAIVLDHGRVWFAGSASEAVKRYYLVEQEEYARSVSALPSQPGSSNPGAAFGDQALDWPDETAFLDLSNIAQVSQGWARCTRVALCDGGGRPRGLFEQGETARFFCEYELLQDIEVPVVGVELVDARGIIVHGKTTLEHGSDVPAGLARGSRVRLQQDIAMDLAVGEYTFTVGIAMLRRKDYEMRGACPHVELDSKLVRLCLLPGVGQFAVAFRRSGAPVQLLHHGIADLPGQCRLVAVLDHVGPPVERSRAVAVGSAP